MSVVITAIDELLPTRFKKELVSVKGNYFLINGELDIDENSTHYPQRSDLKIMRHDVVASIVLTSQLIEKFKKNVPLDDFGLYVASGVFIERSDAHLKHLTQVYEEYQATNDPIERMRKLYRSSPPLLALQTLTNSSMSFIAQYTGIKGNNTTFGTTSSSTTHALYHAFQDALFTKKSSFVCGANCAGPTSFFMNLPFRNYHDDWTESACAASLILEPELQNSNSLCRIKTINIVKEIDFEKLNQSEFDFVFLTGAFTQSDFQNQLQFLQKFGIKPNSEFSKFGNMGPVNCIHSIMKACQLFELGKIKSALILDQDVYNNWSQIHLESC